MNVLGCGGSGGSKNPAAPIVSPQIVSISPTTGGPGTSVSIQGRGFGVVQGNSIVSYSGVTVSPTSWSDNFISVTIPANAVNNGVFFVTVSGVVSNQSTPFGISNPVISGISPTSGGPGVQVTITGQFFGATPGSSYVSFNGQQAQIQNWSTSLISCVVPNPSSFQAGAVSVLVMVDGTRPSNAVTFTVTIPTISNINPASDNVGATITINGSGFGQSQGNSTLAIGGQNAVVVSWSENSIQAKVPQLSSAGSVNVAVTVNGKPSTPSAFTLSGPMISSYSPAPPNYLQKNETVTIYGSHFGSNVAEGSGLIQITGYSGNLATTYWSDTQIQFICPIGGYILPGTQDQTITISVGGFTATTRVTVD